MGEGRGERFQGVKHPLTVALRVEPRLAPCHCCGRGALMAEPELCKVRNRKHCIFSGAETVRILFIGQGLRSKDAGTVGAAGAAAPSPIMKPLGDCAPPP